MGGPPTPRGMIVTCLMIKQLLEWIVEKNLNINQCRWRTLQHESFLHRSLSVICITNMFESMQVQIQRQLFLKQILEMEILVTFPFFFEEMDDYLEYLQSESSSESPLVSECY